MISVFLMMIPVNLNKLYLVSCTPREYGRYSLIQFHLMIYGHAVIFPDSFKIAQVIPLFKGGDRESPNSYRPISLLPSIGKILEKIIATGIIDFLTSIICFHHAS